MVTNGKIGRHDWQPARFELFKKHITVRDAAVLIGVSDRHLTNVLRGTTHPSDAVITGLVAILELPADELFTARALSKPFDGRKTGRRPVAVKRTFTTDDEFAEMAR